MDKTSIGPATAAAPGIRLYKSLFPVSTISAAAISNI